MNARFTVEETNLISIYIYEDRASLIEEMSDALPYAHLDKSGKDISAETISALFDDRHHD